MSTIRMAALAAGIVAVAGMSVGVPLTAPTAATAAPTAAMAAPTAAASAYSAQGITVTGIPGLKSKADVLGYAATHATFMTLDSTTGEVVSISPAPAASAAEP